MRTSKLLILLTEILESGIKLYNEGGIAKLFLVIVTSSCWFPFAALFRKYVFNDWEFLAFFFVLFTLDMITGVYKASGLWDETAKTPNTLSKRTFIIKAGEKLLISAVWLVLANFFQSNVKGSAIASTWLAMFFNGALAAYVSWSVASNLHVITKGQFPPIGIMKRLAKAKDSGKLSDIVEEPESNQPL